ncbi:SulP family inorganic anion transporter [Cerasicoccus frondis]|uniref:SulP family inorganic anion transporter n=1 Tax=Cerasicoccus frondis TaxID=490090 RepID=UPI0028527A20|nr:SulP family inorganic anion transporter [Cerasicoccus frondis]
MIDIRQWWRSRGLDLFPLRKTLREYNLKKAKADFSAAINVALLDFPQGMAYALIAGLPVQIGIFCSSLASITGPMLASSRFVMLGPTNATAVMLLSTFLTLGYTPMESVAALPFLLVLVGLFMIIGSFFKVATITQYISRAVVIGYISAAACLIIVNQLKTVFGLHVPRAGTFAESLWNFSIGLIEADWASTTNWHAIGVGAVTLAIYYGLTKTLKKKLPGLPTVAITLIIMGALTAALKQTGLSVEMLQPINAKDWPLSIPEFHWNELNTLANAAMAIAFLSLLESSSIAKTLAAQAGDRIDLNQQMLSMGAANMVCAFGSGMTVSGSLTRSVLNYKSGAKTAISSIFSGALLIGGLFLLGGMIQYIPRPALAALVITVGISLINKEHIKLMLKTTKSDAAVFLATFGGGLVLPLDSAIYLGAAASMMFFIRKAARPGLKEISFADTGELVEKDFQHERPEIAIVHVEGDLFFASSDMFLEQVRRLAEHPTQKAIILRLRNAYHLDATVAMSLQQLISLARDKGCEILVSGAHEDIERVFRQSGLMELLGPENFFRYSPGNPNVSTRDALKRAKDITGIDTADITIFAAEGKK